MTETQAGNSPFAPSQPFYTPFSWYSHYMGVSENDHPFHPLINHHLPLYLNGHKLAMALISRHTPRSWVKLVSYPTCYPIIFKSNYSNFLQFPSKSSHVVSYPPPFFVACCSKTLLSSIATSPCNRRTWESQALRSCENGGFNGRTSCLLTPEVGMQSWDITYIDITEKKKQLKLWHKWLIVAIATCFLWNCTCK